MNREIIFRGKDFLKEEWVYGDLVKTKNFVAIKRTNGDYFHPTQVSPNTVGQYTGLKDKDGREIYEGDIISIGDPNIKYITMWRSDGFCAKQIGASSYIGLTYWASHIEVLGNVIDNPELIK